MVWMFTILIIMYDVCRGMCGGVCTLCMPLTKNTLNYSMTGRAPSSSWPDKGKIEMVNMHVRYASDLPSVLKAINLTIKPGEKVPYFMLYTSHALKYHLYT